MLTLELFMLPDCPCKTSAIALAKKAVAAVSGVELVLRGEASDQDRASSLGILISPVFVLEGKIFAIGEPRLEQLTRGLRERTEALEGHSL
ncbi:MAG: hypothetical protein ACE5F7_10985 [Nitrospiria bacterium]